MTATVTKGKGLWSIAKENGVKVSDLYKANPGLESMQKKGNIPKNYEIEVPTKSKTNTPKSKSTSKKTVKKSTKKKSTSKVPKESKNTKKCKCDAPWMKIVMKENGTAEVPGKKKNNPRILEYHRASKYWVASEHGIHSWCGSFAAWVMKKYNKKPPKAAYRAASWRKFGKKSSPVYGAIGIKSRNRGNHVSFLVGRSKDNKFYYMIGGNQGVPGKVYIKEYPRKVWDTFRVPKDYDSSNCILPIYTGKIIGGGGD